MKKVVLIGCLFLLAFCGIDYKDLNFSQMKAIEGRTEGWFQFLFDASINHTIASRLELPNGSDVLILDARCSGRSVGAIDTILKYNAIKFKFRLSEDNTKCNVFFMDSLFVSIDISSFDSTCLDGSVPKIICYLDGKLDTNNADKQTILDELRDCYRHYLTKGYSPVMGKNIIGEDVEHYLIWDVSRNGVRKMRNILQDCSPDYVNDYSNAIKSLIEKNIIESGYDRVVVSFPILAISKPTKHIPCTEKVDTSRKKLPQKSQ